MYHHHWSLCSIWHERHELLYINVSTKHAAVCPCVRACAERWLTVAKCPLPPCVRGGPEERYVDQSSAAELVWIVGKPRGGAMAWAPGSQPPHTRADSHRQLHHNANYNHCGVSHACRQAADLILHSIGWILMNFIIISWKTIPVKSYFIQLEH